MNNLMTNYLARKVITIDENTKIDSDFLRNVIGNDSKRQNKIAIQNAYVIGKNPPILQPAPKEEPDNRIPVPFARRAINMILGYLFKEGNIVYLGPGYDDSLKEIFDSNDEGLLDLELGAMALAHGESYELHWSENGNDLFAQIPINQCIPLYDKSLKPNMVGFIRYWTEKDKSETITHVNYYDSQVMQEFISKDRSTYAPGETIQHGYGRVPVVRFAPSKDGSNIFDHVTSLIDFYDKIISEDYADELARFASAYLGMTGRLSDEEDEDTGEKEIDKIKSTRVFDGLDPSQAVANQIAFITKNLPTEFTKQAADRTERLIYEMLQLFNPNDDTFVQASGVAQKYKLLGFEYLCTTITTYFSIGLQDRIALIKGLSSNLTVGRGTINTDVTINWNRNLPDDLAQIATIAAQLKDTLSDETILSLFPSHIVPDVQEELDKISGQKESNMNLFAMQANNVAANAQEQNQGQEQPVDADATA